MSFLAFREGSIGLDKEDFIDLSKKEAFEKVGQTIRENYKKNSGKLGVMGNIVAYSYEHVDGKSYVFDVTGNFLHEEESAK